MLLMIRYAMDSCTEIFPSEICSGIYPRARGVEGLLDAELDYDKNAEATEVTAKYRLLNADQIAAVDTIIHSVEH